MLKPCYIESSDDSIIRRYLVYLLTPNSLGDRAPASWGFLKKMTDLGLFFLKIEILKFPKIEISKNSKCFFFSPKILKSQNFQNFDFQNFKILIFQNFIFYFSENVRHDFLVLKNIFQKYF